MADKHASQPGTEKHQPANAGGADAETHTFMPAPTHEVSDVVLADATTGAAPSLPVPPPPPRPASPARRGTAPMALLPGTKVDDFEIVRLLGRGAFGHVYLARQLSLDRMVALKISANRGSEGRTMARLEHQHIVQVFSEKVEPDFNQRLLCMQLVPGIGLEKLIGVLHAKEPPGAGPEVGIKAQFSAPRKQGGSGWSGATLLSIIDASTSLPAALDPSALHDREALARMDSIEATAWFGGRLAEALDFAHHHGVLHRDIKPANILVNSYGRPMLADFNISSQPVGSEPSGDEMFGGTFMYMSPEHLDAFNPADETGPEAVTARSDIFSLGIVLQQLLDGWLSFPILERKPNIVDTLRAMADERRRTRPICRTGEPGARMTLERTISRCLEPNPEDRFASGAALGEQLDGCRQLRQAEKSLPPTPRALTPVVRRPFLWLVLLVLLPQIAGSALNIPYNMTQIVWRLTEHQQTIFFRLVGAYNAIVYPVAIALLIAAVVPVWRTWRALARAEPLSDEQVETARKQALRLPRWIAALTALGWFPGAVLFPLLIGWLAPPVSMTVAAHFVASFCLSGMIALAYSLCGVEFVVLRVLYPGLWRNARGFGETARRELAAVTTHLRWIQRLAVAIPLMAAMWMLVAGDAANDTFRWLVFGLIVLGMLGSIVANGVTRGLSQVVVALTSTKA